MPVNDDQKPYFLSEANNQAIFENDILPLAFAGSEESNRPTAVFLGGQSGSGKSGLSDYCQKRLMALGQSKPVVINSDRLREYHLDFASLQKTNPQQASYLVNPDTVRWQRKLIRAAVETRRNLLLDGTLGGAIEPIRETMRWLKQEGYHLTVSVLSVPARLSRFGIYKRYEDQLRLGDSGRWVGISTHDQKRVISFLHDRHRVQATPYFRRQNRRSLQAGLRAAMCLRVVL